MSRSWTYACFAIVLAAFAVADARANSPQLNRVDPPGWQRGTEAELILRGRRLDDPMQVVFYEPGITVKRIEAEDNADRDDRRVRVTVEIAEDARLGEHRLRLRTRRGWTDLRTFYVGDMPVVRERDPNSSFDTPQRIEMNTTVEGRITNEDVDYFIVTAAEGERISVEAEAIRLGGPMFDPYVAILDTNRFELASADMTALLLQDAYVSALAPEDGDYIIMIRESAYGGGNNFRYRLHVGNFPRPGIVYPLGGQAGEELEIEYIGDPSGPIRQTITLPGEPTDRLGVFAEHDGRRPPSPNWLRISDFPNVMEAEPNNSVAEATPTDQEPPLAFNGILRKEGDVDFFRFTARQGQRLEFNVYARGMRSPIDPVLSLFTGEGQHLASNVDNGRSLDSYISHQMPEDGEYVVRIRDHLGRGGPDFAYRVEVTPRAPHLGLSIPRVARNDTQSRQFVSAPRGNRWAILLQADRTNFGGDLEVFADNLPEGVTMHAPVLQVGTNRVPVVFEAADDAPLDGVLVDLRARHTERDDIEGRFTHEVELVTGNPNRTAYYTTSVDRLAVTATEAAPFSVRIVEPKVPLLRRGTMDIRVLVERDEGFEDDVRLEFPYRPNGVGTHAHVNVPGNQTEAVYTVNANERAGVGDWPVVVLARANVDGGPLWVSSQVVDLTVGEKLVSGQIQMAVAERGESVALLCELNQQNAFEGEATIELLGLPSGVTAEPMTITSEDEQVIFRVRTGDGSPVGQHRSLFCRLTLMRDGEPIVHTLAHGGVLRIDEPRPEPVAEEPEPEEAAPEPEPEPEPAPRRLTRLEQLRQELENNRD